MVRKDSPSRYAKSKGMKSLTEVSVLTGTSLETLGNWFKNKPKLFEAVIIGCVEIKKRELEIKDEE